MAYLIQEPDLYQVIYQEVIEEITRSNNNIVTTAIATAIDEVSLYLSKYDLVQLLGTPTTDPVFTSAVLKQYCVNIACWYIVTLARVDIDYEHIKFIYESTLKALKMIQSGMSMPNGWPYLATPNPNIPDGDAIEWTARRKKHNYFY